jgi:gamma-glutamyltranspeptidase
MVEDGHRCLGLLTRDPRPQPGHNIQPDAAPVTHVVPSRRNRRLHHHRNENVSGAIVVAFAVQSNAQIAGAYSDRGRDYDRSMVISRFGIVATSQTLASAAAADILRQGGNAVDAAIAANAALSVIEPMMNGIGGDLFAVVYDARTKKLYGINSSGWAPQRLTIDFLKSRGISHATPRKSIHSVTVPRAGAGWDALHRRFGKMPLARVLAPAIYCAAEGVPITEMVAGVWAEAGEIVRDQPNFEKTFLPEGHAPKTGEVFRDADLAASLELIASHGRDGFYRGPLAQRILQFSKEQGGTMTGQDLTEFQPEWVDPISTTYRGWTISELAAQCPRDRGTVDAQHHGAVSTARLWPQQRKDFARDDRGQKACLCRFAPVCRRPQVQPRAG